MNLSDISDEKRITVIEQLAKAYPQLYLVPGDEGQRLYSEVVQKGKPAPTDDLSHFHGSPDDNSVIVDTPAGEVRVVTLGERSDFITFLQIMGERCAPVRIPSTQGALFLDGVINREVSFLPRKDAVIVLSVGAYSAVPADEMGFSQEEWLAHSHTIRLYHECAHFVCYRLHPGTRDAVRDELVADAIGIIAAFGKYDRAMAERFLGIRDGRYTGGRLKNYTENPQQMIPAIDGMLRNIEKKARENVRLAPLDLAICLDDEI